MIFKLALRYFAYNHKRTIKAVKLLSLGLIIVGTIIILINSFVLEINEITSLLGETNNTLRITPNNNPSFTGGDIEDLEIIANRDYVTDYFMTFTNISEIEHLGVQHQVQFHFCNTSMLRDRYFPNTEFTSFGSMFVTDDVYQRLDMNMNLLYFINIGSELVKFQIKGILDVSDQFIRSGAYFDLYYFNLTSNINYFEIEFDHYSNLMDVKNELSEFDKFSVQYSRPEPEFIEKSAYQITRILITLQLIISILVALSIWNIYVLFLYESRFDIRIMLSIGYSKQEVRGMFIIISIMIGLISFVFSMATSYLLVSGTLAALSLIIQSTFISPVISTDLFWYLLINGIVVAFISSVYPIYREVRL